MVADAPFQSCIPNDCECEKRGQARRGNEIGPPRQVVQCIDSGLRASEPELSRPEAQPGRIRATSASGRCGHSPSRFSRTTPHRPTQARLRSHCRLIYQGRQGRMVPDQPQVAGPGSMSPGPSWPCARLSKPRSSLQLVRSTRRTEMPCRPCLASQSRASRLQAACASRASGRREPSTRARRDLGFARCRSPEWLHLGREKAEFPSQRLNLGPLCRAK